MAPKLEKRTKTINVRARKSDMTEIDKAAEFLGITRTQFMLEAAIRRAVSVINNHRGTPRMVKP
jgi:uncharacterized protein (DUF1778 family)